MTDKQKHDGVVEQNEALSVYFDALLRDDQLQEQERQVAAVPPAPSIAEPEPELPPVLATPVIAIPEIPNVESEIVATPPDIQPQPAEPSTPELVTDGPPAWAEQPFQAMLFTVAGLQLAVPLVELSGIHEWEQDEVTPMLGEIDWYLGLMGYRGRSVPVVDTAQLVLPPDRVPLLTPPEERLGNVVFIQEGQWGLACDSVGEVMTLDHDTVKWRSSRSKRRWLAGTVLEHMCAIIDPPAFADMLATGIEDVLEDE